MMFKQCILILLLVGTFVFAAEDTFAKTYGYETSYEKAHAKAVQTNKPMMILFVTSSCPWCQKLKSQTLKKESINTFVQTHFVPVVLDKETDDFPKALMPMVVPTIIFLAPKQTNPFDEILGYKSSDDLLPLLERSVMYFKKSQK